MLPHRDRSRRSHLVSHPDTRPTSPSAIPTTPGARQSSHWITNSIYLSHSLADRWGTTVDSTTSFLHSSRFSAFRSMIFHSRPVHSLMLSSHRFLSLYDSIGGEAGGRGPGVGGWGGGEGTYRGKRGSNLGLLLPRHQVKDNHHAALKTLPLLGCFACQRHAHCISGTDLLTQLHVLPHRVRVSRSNFLSHPVTVRQHLANQP